MDILKALKDIDDYQVIKDLSDSELAFMAFGVSLNEADYNGMHSSPKVIASMELWRRLYGRDITIKSAKDAYHLIRHFAGGQERFVVIALDGANRPLWTKVVALGSADSVVVDIRDVLADAIKDRAKSIITAHNHPSGSIKPSQPDFKTALRIKEASFIVGIRLLDCLVFNQKRFYSMMDHGDV